MSRPQLCPPRWIAGEPYICGRAVEDRDPHANREDGCPGGLFVCADCLAPVVDLVRRAQDAKAIRQEHEEMS